MKKWVENGENECPVCGGFDVIIVLKRAWCVKRYDLGGCGSFFRCVGGPWKRGNE